MPRPAGMSPLRYVGVAALDRATALAPVARLRERAIAARSPDPSGPALDGLPLPPARLRVVVDAHGDPDGFVRAGGLTADLIRDAVESGGFDLEGRRAVLDFGCGCGRVARHWAGLRGPDLHGCDYNPDFVAWCAGNLPFMAFRANSLEPPAPYADGSFDLVYAISVLTHLPEPLAHAWMADWVRVLRPGGLLLVTTHGDAYKHRLGRRLRPRYDTGEMVTKAARMAGANACVAHHPPAYVRDRLLAGLDIVSHTSGVASTPFPQDIWLARVPSG